MNKRFNAVPWIIGITAGLLLALMIAPSTRLIMKLEFRAAILLNSDIFKLNNLGRVAKKYPDDMGIQIAAILSQSQNPGTNNEIRRYQQSSLLSVHNLIDKFPDQPVVYAVALKQMLLMGVAVGRENDQNFPPYNTQGRSVRQQDPIMLKDYISYCTAGEKLDSQNAFFPFMRSVGLFAMGRDSEALKEIKIASQKPDYKDYSSINYQYIIRLTDLAAGGKNAFLRSFVFLYMMFPEYSQMGSSARIALHDAVLLERKGDLQGGFAIRQALRRYGSLMTSDATLTVGNMVGSSIAKRAMNHFPGAPPLPIRDIDNLQKHPLLQSYMSYLYHIHQPAEAAACQEQENVLENIIKLDQQHMNDFSNSFQNTAFYWYVGMIELLCVVWLMVFWIFTIFIHKSPAINIPEWAINTIKTCSLLIPFLIIYIDLSRLASIHLSGAMLITGSLIILMMFFAILLWMWRAVLHDWRFLDAIMLIIWSISIMLYGLYCLFLPGTIMAGKNALLVEILILFTVLLLLADRKAHQLAGIIHRSFIFVSMVTFVVLILHVINYASGWMALGVTNIDLFLKPYIGNSLIPDEDVRIITVIIPEAMLMLFALISFIHREPLAHSISGRAFALFPSLACIVLIIWMGIVMVTLHEDAKLSIQQEKFITGESQSNARLSHMEWPKAVR